jgi:hypothetical protein
MKKHTQKGASARAQGSSCVREQLQWYFGYAESALRRKDVALLPTYAARALSARPTDTTCRRRAAWLARVASLPSRHASVLRAAYTPRRWPRRVMHAFAELSPIAVRLVFASDPWPDGSGRSGLEQAAARRRPRRSARRDEPPRRASGGRRAAS